MSNYFKYFFLFVFLFGNILFVRSQEQPNINISIDIVKSDKNAQLIIFHKDRPLTLNDFKGTAPEITQGVAATYSGIKMGYSSAQDKTKIDIKVNLTCYFDPSKSWMKKEGKTLSTLEHEQGHFNITFIQMCRFSEAISKYKFTRNWKTELLNLRQKYMDELNTMQDNYDKTTIHGTLKEQQIIYSQQINTRLKEIDCNPS